MSEIDPERSVPDLLQEINDWTYIAQEAKWIAPSLPKQKEIIQSIQDLSAAALERLKVPEPPPVEEPPGEPPPPQRSRVRGNFPGVLYGNGQRNWVNILEPADGGLDSPCCVVIHGGGLRPMPGVSGLVPPEVTQFLLNQGYVVCEVAYPYSNGYPEVCVAAIVKFLYWLSERYQQYGIDGGRVLLIGHSAGGWLAVRAAMHPEAPIPKGVLGLAPAWLHVEADTWLPPMTESITLQAWGYDRAQWDNYSPHTHMEERAERCAIWLVHGANDDQIPYQMSQRFQQDAGQHGWWCGLNVVPGGDHFSVGHPANYNTYELLRELRDA